MSKEIVIENTRRFVKEKLENEGSGHDWYHIERVYNLARYLCREEGGNSYIIELAALLHDIEDWKFSKANKSDTSIIEEFLLSEKVEMEDIKKVISIIKTLSFKGGVVSSKQDTIEGMIVQDADRLDAMGAIGIARTFTYGGYKGNLIYDPTIEPMDFKSLDEVKNKKNHTINHFYEKLLKLKDLINTRKGKELAGKRHRIMEQFLDDFIEEWNFK
ncbi:HD domain-containing protein [uncultured Clostridium sp.]|uniref:HD domain-containing protein n=1 Tax=uncultured Clostridium sp. TaxID=59620 RepID=UPI0026154E8D|nr:HD domain-containing protein [uncultured Clostridium sp.]